MLYVTEKCFVEKFEQMIAEGKAQLTLKDRHNSNKTIEIQCFIPHGTQYFEEGKKYYIYLYSGGTLAKKLGKRKIEIIDIREKQTYASNYLISGKVLQVRKHPDYKKDYLIVIDCGVLVNARIGGDLNPKIGDYFQLDVRLDVHKVKRVGGEKRHEK
ncbi:Uncharacterised protein [uncultured archaeon]|nr:Uncharacterised protein [uncultured archaeon]